MRSSLLLFAILLFGLEQVLAQNFVIQNYDINLLVKSSGEIQVEELIKVNFNKASHGILRAIPFKYRKAKNSDSSSSWSSIVNSQFFATALTDIRVEGFPFKKQVNGDYQILKIGSPDIFVENEQNYHLYYTVHDAILHFKDHSEFYFNVLGTDWKTNVEKCNFKIQFEKSFDQTPKYYVYSGQFGSKENSTFSTWKSSNILEGNSTRNFEAGEGITVGIELPKGFVAIENYSQKYFSLLFIIPFGILSFFFSIWYKYGKDYSFTLTTEFYPPKGIGPAVAGYLIDDKLNKRDLTAHIPYWGEQGYLRIELNSVDSFLGLSKEQEITFIKLKDLPQSAGNVEKTLFNGLFDCGNSVSLSSLKDSFYLTMEVAKNHLRNHIDAAKYYYEISNLWKYLMLTLSIVFLISGVFCYLVSFNSMSGFLKWFGLGLAISSISGFIIFWRMPKKTKIGTEIYKKLCGFKEFIKTVEKDKLQEMIKEDSSYFDKVLPYAIVFGVADEWRKKFKDLEIPTPSWYSSSGPMRNYYYYMDSMNTSLNDISDTFYSSPSSSSASGGFGGGSYSGGGGGGFSGGGFGGGGGSSW
ncbi:MAG TPA: DUF2207 domain-containing protein [Saprospiraceae bacterium]|nr:DUF2207 domain-containing protein [Saprospiraceae bacterium]